MMHHVRPMPNVLAIQPRLEVPQRGCNALDKACDVSAPNVNGKRAAYEGTSSTRPLKAFSRSSQ